jgi:hypothetical protein
MTIDSLTNKERQLIKQFRKAKKEHSFKQKLYAAPKYKAPDNNAGTR